MKKTKTTRQKTTEAVASFLFCFVLVMVICVKPWESSDKQEPPQKKIEKKSEIVQSIEKKTAPDKTKKEWEWLTAGMRIYPGVKVYYGAGTRRQYMGTVLDIGKVYDPNKNKMVRAVLFEMANGSTEWKYRDDVITWGYIKSDDSAYLQAKESPK